MPRPATRTSRAAGRRLDRCSRFELQICDPLQFMELQPSELQFSELQPSDPQLSDQLQPLVPPHDTHLRHVPLRTSVKAPQPPHGSPS